MASARPPLRARLLPPVRAPRGIRGRRLAGLDRRRRRRRAAQRTGGRTAGGPLRAFGRAARGIRQVRTTRGVENHREEHGRFRATARGTRTVGLFVALAGLLLLSGCSRAFWRKQADRDSYEAVRERTHDPRWNLPRIDVTPDPRSRFYDVYDADKPPLPPDDPAAHAYMHRADGWLGYRSWHQVGDAFSVENPQWLARFALPPAAVPANAPVPGGGPQPYGTGGAPGAADGGVQLAGAASRIPERVARDPRARADSGVVPASYETAADAAPAVPQTGPAPSTSPAPSSAPDLRAVPDPSRGPVLQPVPDAFGPGSPATSATGSAVGLDPALCPPGSLSGSPAFGLEKLTLEQSLELANINSREYQTEIENLYLSALDLTFERFQFDVRYLGLGGREPGADLLANSVPGGENNVRLGTRFGISRVLPTGGQWVVEIANQTLWLFSGPNQTNTASLLSYSLVQPLLFGAGRKVVLESLTQNERNVLYSARSLARFRKIFFVDTVSGGNSGGYLGLLQLRQTISNQRFNIALLENQLELLRALASQRPEEISERLPALPPGFRMPAELAPSLRFDAERQLLIWRGEMTAGQEKLFLTLGDAAFRAAADEIVQRLRTDVVTLDVAQLQSRLANSRNALRETERRFQDALDAFKIQLGLPTDLRVTLDESLLEPFVLIDPRLRASADRFKEFVGDWARLDEEAPAPAVLADVLARLRALRSALEQDGLRLVESDFERAVRHRATPPSRTLAVPDPARLDAALARDRRQFAALRDDFARTSARVEALAVRLGRPDVALAERQEAVREIGMIREQFLRIAQNLQVLQVGLRVELIVLNPFDMPLDQATAVGLDERLDLMNRRALVMDARRRMEVAANALQAVLDVRAEGDVSTPLDKDNPVDFRGARSSFRAGVAFTAPLDQIAERNAYRESLVAFQRARRDYMAFEDGVKLEVRTSWRRLDVLARNFETARQAVRFAALQYDQAVENTIAPLPAGQAKTSGSQGLNLINALNSILSAQNDVISIWVDYERSRLNIHLDMDMMEIDPSGVWVDPFYRRTTAGLPHDTDPAFPASAAPPVLVPPPAPAADPPVPMPPAPAAGAAAAARSDRPAHGSASLPTSHEEPGGSRPPLASPADRPTPAAFAAPALPRAAPSSAAFLPPEIRSDAVVLPDVPADRSDPRSARDAGAGHALRIVPADRGVARPGEPAARGRTGIVGPGPSRGRIEFVVPPEGFVLPVRSAAADPYAPEDGRDAGAGRGTGVGSGPSGR